MVFSCGILLAENLLAKMPAFGMFSGLNRVPVLLKLLGDADFRRAVVQYEGARPINYEL